MKEMKGNHTSCYPTNGAHLVLEGAEHILRFELIEPAGTQTKPARSKTLTDFAYNGTELVTTPNGARQTRVSSVRLENLANNIGPVFGPNEKETLKAWVEAVTVAQYAVQMQLALNGQLSFSSLNEIFFKTTARPVTSGVDFELCYCIAQADSVEYPGALAEMPQAHRFGKGRYSFATLLDEEGGCKLAVAVLRCKAEMTGADFLQATQDFTEELTEAQIRRLREQMDEAGFDMDMTGLKVFDKQATYCDMETPLSARDSELVEMAVKTLISLHVSDVEIDLFRSGGEPLMDFPNHLSYLWFSFATERACAKVGFCKVCGRGFNMNKWRGRTKHCCPQCGDTFRNHKVANQRDLARRLFIEEERSVSQIAQEVYSGFEEAKAQAKVREVLSTYPNLKSLVRKEPDGEIAARCKSEGVVFTQRKKSMSKGDAG